MFSNKKTTSQITNSLQVIYPRLWRYCLALTGSKHQADDLAQMAALRVLEKAHQFKAGTNFDRWIFKITQRLWINELRKQAVRTGGGISSVDEIDLPDDKPNQEMNLFARQVLLEVMALPEAQRGAVVLAYIEGYSYKEVAEILEIPIGTVMSRLSTARTKLAGKMQNTRGAV